MRRTLTLALLASLLLPASGQTPPTPQDEDVVTITSNLVQVDAVVTDEQGRQVTDLTAEDFELAEDGRARAITNFSYVSTAAEGGAGANARADAARGKTRPPVPPARVKPGQARRVFAFIVDDLGLSFDTTAHLRQHLRKFVREQMREGDLVAVIRTSAGVGALQQFSGDRRLVELAVERVRFSPGRRAPTGSFGEHKEGGEDSEADYENLFTVGTLGALNYVLRGLRDVPGRKSVVLITENIRIFNRRRRDQNVRNYLRELADLANRSLASVYTLDAKELKPGSLSDNQSFIPLTPRGGEADPRDSVGRGVSPQQSYAESLMADLSNSNRRGFYESKSALRFLARETGGDEAHGLGRVIEDQRGYYLIGFRPGDAGAPAAAGRPMLRNVTLRVKRAGLRVRLRSAFSALDEREARPVANDSRESQLIRALTSPFASDQTGQIGLRLTSLFGNDQQTGSFVRSLLHVDARDLKFTEEPGGFRQAVLDVLALTFGETGQAVDEVNRIETVRVGEEEYRKLLREGLRYTIKVPVAKPGAYQLRLAVRDAATSRLGSATELIEVPDIAAGRLAVSGIVLSGVAPEAKGVPASAGPPAASAQGATAEDPEADPSVRRLRPGMALRYDFVIYNARPDAEGRPQLRTQIRLFREGRLAYEGKPAPFVTAQTGDITRLRAGGQLTLNAAAQPGEYALQVVVTDALAKETARVATQWIDFEIVK